MTNSYEGVIGGYSFLMKESDTIEVWENLNAEYPISYIYVKPGSVSSEKLFQIEISDWFIKNIG